MPVKKLTPDDLWTLEDYVRERDAFRKKVLPHKRLRQVAVGPNMTLLFEDRLLIQYQVQEMLRIERLTEPKAIQDELDAYNPLIPDGANWKATCLIEFEDIDERRTALKQMHSVEDHIWVQADGQSRVTAIADEDMERSDEDKTSAVHFLRFELPQATIEALRGGATLRLGVDHPSYTQAVTAPDESRASLLNDLD